MVGNVTKTWLSLGSNVGERATFVRGAVEQLRALEGFDVLRVSSLYETAPVGGPPQRSYVNAVVAGETTLAARDLLLATQAVERKMGREESFIRWGPRVIDVDIVAYGDEKISEPDLEIPHPRLNERRFVLVPLLEIEPGMTDPWGDRYSTRLDEAEGEVILLGPL